MTYEDTKRGWDLDGLPFKCLFDSPQPCPECDEKQSAIDVWEGRYADKTAECEKLKAKIDLTNTLAQQSNQDHLNVRKDYQGDIIKLKAEREELAAQVEAMREALGNAEITIEKLRNGLENCRLFAARNRKEDWALLILGFCAEAGVVGSVTR